MPRLLESWRHIVPGYLYSDPVTPYYYGHETMVCAVCLSIFFMNSWYGQIASSDIRVLAPNSALCHRHAALLPCMVPYWWLTPNIYVSTSIFFRQSVPGRRVYYSRGNKLEQGWPCSPFEPSEGVLNRCMGLPALLGGNLGYWTFKSPPLYCTVYGVCHRQNTLWP